MIEQELVSVFMHGSKVIQGHIWEPESDGLAVTFLPWTGRLDLASSELTSQPGRFRISNLYSRMFLCLFDGGCHFIYWMVTWGH